jgi:predicted aminopeptidase
VRIRTANTLFRLLQVLGVLQLAACAGPTYYAQAIGGHLELMRQREPVAEVLASDAADPGPGVDADPGLRQKLVLAQEIRAFGVSRLGLPDNGSYTQFVRTGRDAVTWNVVATPEFSMTPRRWCFLFAGCLPYRGYFEQASADRFAERLAADGLDVAVSGASAYSTLGWFEDPLLDTMLRYGEERLAAIIFHELAHQRLYVEGDAAFSESYASFVEEEGVALWLRESGRSDRLPAWRKERAAARQFDAILRRARSSLAEVYASDQAPDARRDAKEAVFAALRADYRALVNEHWGGRDRFGGWFESELNNARLALLDTYRAGMCAFEALYREAGEDMRRFHELADARAALDRKARHAWLEQDCDGIASRGEL